MTSLSPPAVAPVPIHIAFLSLRLFASDVTDSVL